MERGRSGGGGTMVSVHNNPSIRKVGGVGGGIGERGYLPQRS